MILKVFSDGTPQRTTVTDECGNVLDKVLSISWRNDWATQRAILTVEVETPEIYIEGDYEVLKVEKTIKTYRQVKEGE